jgi:hypothetical protein
MVEDELHEKKRQISNPHYLFIGTVHLMVHIYIKHYVCDQNLEVMQSNWSHWLCEFSYSSSE